MYKPYQNTKMQAVYGDHHFIVTVHSHTLYTPLLENWSPLIRYYTQNIYTSVTEMLLQNTSKIGDLSGSRFEFQTLYRSIVKQR